MLHKAKSALLGKLQGVYERLESNRSDSDSSDSNHDPIPSNSTATENTLSPEVLASVFGSQNSQNTAISAAQVIRPYNTPEEELRVLFETIQKLGRFNKWKTNPIDIYTDVSVNLRLSRELALDFLAMPAGEAPSERIFSIASRVMKFDRTRMSAAMLANTTFIKKNKLALGINV